MKKDKFNTQWNWGVGAAVGLVLGSSVADLIAPGSSIVGLVGLFTGALIGALLGRRMENYGRL